MSANVGWSIGVGLGVGSSIVSNVGVNIQKLAHSHREEEVKDATAEHLNDNVPKKLSDSLDSTNTKTVNANEKPKTLRRDSTYIRELAATLKAQQQSYLCDWKWMVGLVLQIIGAIMDFCALSVAPASVVAPLGSLTLVTNVFLAPLMHNQRLTKITLLATFLIIFGTIATVIFSPRTSGVHNTQQVFALFKTQAFVAYALPTAAILIVTFLITKYMNYLKRNGIKTYGQCYYKLHRFCIATLSGTMGAQNVFVAKMVSTLLLFTVTGKGNMFVHWQSYLIIVGLLMTIYFQLKWLNEGLQNFSALHIVPVFQSFWITVSVIGGLTVYQEFAAMRTIDKLIFPVGVVITIAGVALLTSQQKPKERSNKNQHKNKLNSISENAKESDTSNNSGSTTNGSSNDAKVTEIEMK